MSRDSGHASRPNCNEVTRLLRMNGFISTNAKWTPVDASQIEVLLGCRLPEAHTLYGANVLRRYEATNT